MSKLYDKIWIPCKACGRYGRVALKHVGKKVRCKKCGATIPVPMLSTACVEDSPFIPAMTNKSIAENDGNFRFICQGCNKRYKMTTAMENALIICSGCEGVFIAKSYKLMVLESANRVESGSLIAADEPVIRMTEPDCASDESVEIQEMCSVCRTEILPEDDRYKCPSCKIPFHKECWEENLGCAAYGCDMVDCLRQGPDIKIDKYEQPITRLTPVFPAIHRETDFPREYALVFATVLAALFSTFLFGLPSLAIGTVAACFLSSAKGTKNTTITVVCLGINIIGFVLGIYISYQFRSG